MEPTDTQSSTPADKSEQTIAPPIQEASNSATSSSNNSPKKLFGKIGIVPAIIIAAVLLIGGSAAAYFGLVLPNQPENIWQTALENTAKGYDKLVEYADEQKDVSGGKVSGTFKFDTAEIIIDGMINGKFDQKTADIKLDAGAAGTRVNFNIITNIPESATTPDIYLKADGLTEVGKLIGNGDPSVSEYFTNLDGKYYFIDHTLIDQVAKSAQQDQTGLPQLSPEEIKETARKIGEVNKEYLFATDTERAVLVVKSELGKDTVDGREMYHYKVGYDKENLKEYATKLHEAIEETKLKDVIIDESFDGAIKDIEELDGNGEADVWIDMKTKLIRTVRFVDPDSKTTVDIGLDYDGGSSYPFYVSAKSEDNKNDFMFKLTLDAETNKVNLLFDAATDKEGRGNINLDIEPSNETVQFNKPEGAQSLSDLLEPFLGSGMLNQGSDEDLNIE